MKSLTKFTYSDLKSLYDFLEMRKGVVSANPDDFEDGEIHDIINKQKIVWLELHSRTNEFEELKFK